MNLFDKLSKLDIPYQAWAIDALSASEVWEWKDIARQLLDQLGDSWREGTSHAELVSAATLSSRFRNADERTALVTRLPPADLTPNLRSRLYDSATYLYLVARGLGKQAADLPGFSDIVVNASERAAANVAQNTEDIALLIAARIECGIEDTNALLARRLHALISSTPVAALDYLPFHWLLERYESRWPRSDEHRQLRETLQSRIAEHGPVESGLFSLRPVALLMQLEAECIHNPKFRFVREADYNQDLSGALRSRRITGASATILILIVMLAVPLFALKGGLYNPTLAWFSLSVAGIPMFLLTVTWYYGRRAGAWLWTAIIAGVAYYLAAVVAMRYSNQLLLANLNETGTRLVFIAPTVSLLGRQIARLTR